MGAGSIGSLFSPLRLFYRALRLHPHDFLQDAYLWANAVFLATSIGYVALDFSSARASRISDGTYVVLALAYTLDALLYWLSWKGAWPHPSKTAITAEYLNIAMSLGYLATASMYHAEAGPARTDGLLGAIVVIEALFAAGFVVDAVSYAWAWKVEASKRKNLMAKDVGFWVHVCNVIPSILTLISEATTACGHWLLVSTSSSSSTSDEVAINYSAVHLADVAPDIYRLAQIFTLTADIGYLICSVLCFACWFRDLELELFPVDDPTQAAAAGAPADDAAVKRPLLARAPSAMQLLRQVSMQISAESCDQTTAADEPANDARKSTSRMSSVASVAMPAMHAEHASSTVVGVPSDQSHDAIISRCTAVGDADVEHAIRSLVVHATSNIRKPLHLQRQLERGMVDANIVLSASDCHLDHTSAGTPRPRALTSRLPSRANIMSDLAASLAGSPRTGTTPRPERQADVMVQPLHVDAAQSIQSKSPAPTRTNSEHYSASLHELAAANFDLRHLQAHTGYELLGPCKAACRVVRRRQQLL